MHDSPQSPTGRIEHLVPVPYAGLPALEDVIEAQWRSHQKIEKASKIVPHVFHRDGEAVKDFRKAWRSACKAAGVAHRIPHDLRRTAVRSLGRAGVPERTAMQITDTRRARCSIGMTS
jgi:integrase